MTQGLLEKLSHPSDPCPPSARYSDQLSNMRKILGMVRLSHFLHGERVRICQYVIDGHGWSRRLSDMKCTVMVWRS